MTASNVSRNRLRDVRLMRSIAVSSCDDRRFQVGLLRGQEVEALLQLFRLLDRRQVDLAHALDQAAQLARAPLLLGAEQRRAGGTRAPRRRARRRDSDRPPAPAATCAAGRPPGCASPGVTRVWASRATSARAARSCASPSARCICRSSSALCRSPCARARASASACHRAASSRNRVESARSVTARASSSASVASRRAARASSSARAARSRSSVCRAFCCRSSAWLAVTFSVVSSPTATSTASASATVRSRSSPARSSAAAAVRASLSRPASASSSRRSLSSADRARSAACVGQLLPARLVRALLLGDTLHVLAQAVQRHVVAAQHRRRLFQRPRDLRRRLLALDLARQRALDVGVQTLHHLLELADLALLLQHAGHRRFARAAGHDAVRIDDLAVQGHDGLVGARLPPQRQRALQIVDHQHVAQQVRGDLVVLPVVADQLQHRTTHAVTLRPRRCDRVRIDDRRERRHRVQPPLRPRRPRRRRPRHAPRPSARASSAACAANAG